MKFLLLCTFVGLIAAQHDPYWWPNRSGIVHLFSWKYTDIANECENFLAPKGYAGVLVSPVQEHIVANGRPWWERYQPVSYKIFSRSGGEKEFWEMTRRCSKVGIRIYVDIVINHMATGQGPMIGVGGSTADPDKSDFPNVPYSANDFNQPQCNVDPCFCNAINMRNCNLYGLPDLNLTRSNVRENVITFMNRLIELGAAGFQVDAAKHMWPSDLQQIFSKLRNLDTLFGFPLNARPFLFQEIIDFDGKGISKFEYIRLGRVTEYKFSFTISTFFRGKWILKNLRTFGGTWEHFLLSYQAVPFMDNPYLQRENANALTYKEPRLYKMATAFHLAWPYGVPLVMSSFHFNNTDQGPPMDANENIMTPIFNADNSCGGGWVCEHRWRPIYNMIGFRNAVQGTNVEHWWDNGGSQIAFSRDNKGFIAFNGQFRVNLNRLLQTGLPAGVYCDVISGSKIDGACTGKIVTVLEDGRAEIVLGSEEEDGILAIHVNAKL